MNYMKYFQSQIRLQHAKYKFVKMIRVKMLKYLTFHRKNISCSSSKYIYVFIIIKFSCPFLYRSDYIIKIIKLFIPATNE